MPCDMANDIFMITMRGGHEEEGEGLMSSLREV
jgi:hypothetical protein